MSRATLHKCKRGAVYVEFLIVFMPMFILFLCMIQYALLYTAHLGVQHAATSAVRSAIVVLPDDPVAYEGDAPYQISRTTCSAGYADRFHKALKKLGIDSRLVPKDGLCAGGPRMSTIRFAAIMRMVPFAPNVQQLLPDSLGKAVGSLGTLGWLAGAVAYSYGATAVTFHDENGMRTGATLPFEPGKPVTARVTYLAHCGIPIARFFMCDRSSSLHLGFDLDALRRNPSSIKTIADRIKRSQGGLDELSEGVGNRTLLLGLYASDERFKVLREEATLPIQSAPYTYKAK